MKMTRTFQPVGQGAFYTEQFCKDDGGSFNIVYDCGSDSLDYESLSKVIQNSFAKGTVIDAVFISHFDNDHVNGLPELMKNFWVKKIFLPVVTGAVEIAYWRFKSNVDSSEGKKGIIPVADRFLDPGNTDSEKIFRGISLLNIPEIIRIQQFESDARPDVNVCDNVGLSNWQFVPFNFKRFEREADFRAVLQAALEVSSSDTMVDDFISKPIVVFQKIGLDESKKLLRNINKILRDRLRTKRFRKRFGSINANSMVLYSGEKDVYGQFRLTLRCQCDIERSYKAGSLYLGDYAAQDNEAWVNLVSFYKSMKCWDGIGCVQLPHHGSRRDFNSEIGGMDACFAVSFGLGNRHHHPGKDVIVSLLQNDKTVLFSTEAKFYRNFQHVQQIIN